jgi:hypothetical protein
MRFAIELGDLGRVKLAPATEPEDLASIIAAVCTALADADTARFKVSGFGDDAWPVDVRFDLAVIVPQLPKAIAAVRQNRDAELDFFAQGVERIVRFSPRNTSYLATCRSRIGWEPRPASLILRSNELLALLQGLARDFIAAVQQIPGGYYNHPLLQSLKDAAAA